MNLEVIDYVLAERHPHPRLSDRVTGKVRAVLSETIDGQELRHELMVPVWVDIHTGMGDDDIELGLMVKAADIVGRLRQQLRPATPDPLSEPDA